MMELTEEQQAELQALEDLADEDIDFTDIPDRPVDWSTAGRGAIYPPVHEDVTLSLDESVIEWFKTRRPDGKTLDQAINTVLLNYILRERTRPRR